MSLFKRIVLPVVLSLAMAACQPPSPTALPTPSPAPTYTLTATALPTATLSPTPIPPTLTPTPSVTPIPTSTRTPIPTATPLPPTPSPTRLLPTPTAVPPPPAAPRGQIAFASQYEGPTYLYVVNADGTGQRRLANLGIWPLDVPLKMNAPLMSWSSDGQQIAYIFGPRGASDEVFLIQNDGFNRRTLAAMAGIASLTWSPKGDTIAFISIEQAGSAWRQAIQIVNVENRQRTQLSIGGTSTQYRGLSWSPVLADGSSRLAFVANLHGNYEIYTMYEDGSGLLRLTNNSADDGSPTWSPSGDQMIFVSNRDGNYDLYRMDADGNNVTRLTNTPASEFTPSWSPYGDYVAFTSDRDGRMEIYTMALRGGSVQRVTFKGGDHPAWGR